PCLLSGAAFAKETATREQVRREQPHRAVALNGMKRLPEDSRRPVIADGTVLSHQDAMRVRWGACARAVNLKLMKHGGLSRASEVNAVCESAALPAMVGCMGESVVSVAAGLHFALAIRNVRWAEFDSHFAIERDVAPRLRFEGGDLIASEAPGLGVRVDDGFFR